MPTTASATAIIPEASRTISPAGRLVATGLLGRGTVHDDTPMPERNTRAAAPSGGCGTEPSVFLSFQVKGTFFNM